MDWTKFNNHGESPNHAFEVMCNILFKCWLKKEYKDNISHFAFVNGSGGDGGVEAYGLLKSGDIIGVQSKWFPQKMEASQFKQIENSFYTAIKVRPELKRYIVCIPRDFTSKKMVKNNQVARDTEESKWINLCENINKEYPDVVIELWDETSIQEKLCLPETQGCYRYWFECSDVFETEILISYQRAINSWAKTKYIPDLYSTGYIHDKLSSFTGSFEATKKKYDMTQNIYAIVQKLKRAYEDILRLQFPENEKALFEKVKSDISVLGEWLCIIREIGSLVASGSDIERDNFEKKFELNCDSSELKDSSLHFSYYNHFHEVESILDNIEDDFEQFKRCMISDSHNKIIFLGNQGTGKTAGIVSEIDLMLQDKSFLPVLVQAKDYRKGDSWLSILTRTIGLSTTWSELELFQALENAALLRNRYLNESCDIVVQPKCLICVDGIDEASSWSFWKERIEETQVYEGIFPNVKFVFLSRPYVFPRYYDLDYRECFYTLPSSGDVSVNELFDDYIAFYKIDLCGNYWIKEKLSTPMALKLFCDLYGNSSVGNLDKNSLVITKLFQKKINSVEESYRKQEKETNQQSMIKTILVNIATLLTNKNELTFEDRYYCKGIVKIAISKGLCDAECEKRISEKYIRKSSFMPAYKDSFDSKRLSGYGPIYYDLARYVLCDHLDRFFCINYKTREYLREAEEFIEKYKKKYDVDMLEPEGLIISIAFQYLLNQGWDEKIFWECEDKNNLGIDICIRNTYMRSTHGAKSKVMTVAEKYVWCVKHRMEAVFASQLQYNYYGQGVRYISDYYEIDDFTNTYQDYVNSRYTKIEDKWIHTDQMVKTPYKEFSAENIEKWMKKKDTPDFTVWLGEKTDARILYAYTNIVNEVLGIEEAIWISSGIVKNNDFEKLIAEVNVYSEERSELLNVAEFHSYVETCGFYTPQEVCAVQSVKEANESINIGNEKNVIQVYKLVATCLSEHIENIEKTFYLPSRIARILTGITYGDGYEYINDNNEVVCKYSDVSKGENNQQECLQINSHILESSLKENDYRMFWVFRVYRSPSSKAYELYGRQIMSDKKD